MTKIGSIDTEPEGFSTVPAPALWLGGTGAIPFAFCALAAVFAPQEWTDLATRALAFYGAVILSFLGGIQWGLAISAGVQTNAFAQRLCLSVVPSLIGWGALFLPPFYGLLVMAAAFALVLYLDLQATTRDEAPAWYPKLRVPLSAAAMASLAVGAAVSI
ncbi:DUF3429 domain-containing protein [Roseibium sp. MMSF_3544]|uniref:DUF3429 domain-containing protein n=1 Tax=unclassified Roseibium TaxID=2629323 RepID=UPI00273D4023|nr:DUF3429 domain-containing protein [Roseibium sp. MMSF_3544]